ncbi:PDCD2L family protein [Megaselia abdita]
MAKIQSTVFLGYEDEEINENLKKHLNYSTNKVGGLPDFFPALGEVKVSNCPICNLSRPLVLQIYAPLENSKFHRTLYIFSCLNPTCSVQSNSWQCIRVEHLEKFQDFEVIGSKNSTRMNWCSGEDDWEDEEDFNDNEQNGNLLYPPPQSMTIDNRKNYSDEEEDDSNSMENDIVGGINALQVGDDKNANCAGAQGGITVNIPSVFAEIEGEESEVISVDSPKAPERDLIALMKHTSGASLMNFTLTLKSFFLAVEEESSSKSYDGISDEHIRDLYSEYQKHDEVSKHSPTGGSGSSEGGDGEQYENAVPAHGDMMFYNFLETIQRNPGQIVR